MGMPGWWGARRYGMFVHANLATVPAWAPIGQYADWYWQHLTGDRADALVHDQPLVEVIAHHRDRWGHVAEFDDFAPLLTFDRCDPEQWARLAVEAGMGYAVHVTKHHDGWCWWDAPGTDRTFFANGPKRDVVAEFAAACERNDIVFGTYYSLLDWGDPRFGSAAYVDEVLHPHVLDLVECYGAAILWGDGQWGHGPDHWRTRELLDRVWSLDPAVVVNDRWWARPDDVPAGSPPLVRTFEYHPPDGVLDGPWELCRGIGHSFCHNRAERPGHHMTAADIVALYTEVVAKGGNLLLNVGVAVDGTIPELQAAPLRTAGGWIRRHDDLLARSVPWSTWGDDRVRYVHVDDALHAVDLTGAGRFAGIDPAEHRVASVTLVRPPDGGDDVPIAFTHDAGGLRLHLPAEHRAASGRRAVPATMYRLEVEPVEAPIELFTPAEPEPIELAPLLAGAAPGTIIQLGDGTYTGPAVVPAGVVLRGLGARRTTIHGGGATAVRLQRGARIEHLSVGGSGERLFWIPAVAVRIEGAAGSVLGCEIDGHVHVAADDTLIRATTLHGVIAEQTRRTTISRCTLRGNRWDTGVRISGGSGHIVDSCELDGHLAAVRLTATTGAVVRGNTISARWWGVRLERTEASHVHGNQVRRTMRAVDVDGGLEALIDGNAVSDGDSGCLLQNGAARCTISGNRWERCRVGLFGWEVVDLHDTGNQCIEVDDCERVVTDPS